MLHAKTKLTLVQMMNLGMHIGHSLLVSKFLSYWIYGGWRGEIFIINLVRTRIMFKVAIESIYRTIYHYKPFWFINLDPYMGVFINRYAILCGESYCNFQWINGMLTNFRSIFSWSHLLFDLLLTNKFIMRTRDKKRLLSLVGFTNHRLRPAYMGFVSSTLKSWKAVNEFWVINMPCVAVIDSNVLSWNVPIPLPGNDDSILCLNYYCFVISRSIIYSKGLTIRGFHHRIANKNKFIYIKELNLKRKAVLSFMYSNDYFFDMQFKKKVLFNKTRVLSKFLTLDWKLDVENTLFDLKLFNTTYSAFRNNSFFDILLPDGFTQFNSSAISALIDNDPFSIY